MSLEPQATTLAIIKPDVFRARRAGAVVSMLEDAGFTIRASRVLQLKREEAEAFYAIHRERNFFDSLVKFMTSGVCSPLALEHERAVPYLREVIGATDPGEAKTGTVRAVHGESKERNAIHGSDSDANARIELGFFFSQLDWMTKI